jgi:hypothetical protein
LDLQPRSFGLVHSRQKSLNRFGASAVYTAVLVIDRWPSRPWIARVCVPLVGECVTAGVAQHVRVRLDPKLGARGRAFDRPGEAGGGDPV